MKSLCTRSAYSTFESHPARGAWIEIDQTLDKFINHLVAPREGCVD